MSGPTIKRVEDTEKTKQNAKKDKSHAGWWGDILATILEMGLYLEGVATHLKLSTNRRLLISIRFSKLFVMLRREAEARNEI
jgi:hypothetical protein